MKTDDVVLIRRILAGDETAFAELVKKYQKPVHTLAWRKIGDFHIAEDITQETFLKVYQRLHTLKDPNQFSGWLYVITANLCATWLRKKRIQTQPLEDTETTMIQEDAYSQHVVEERTKTASESQREVVKKLLAKLKESERTVMTLHYLGEMTVAEISRFLGVSTSTIKSRLRRARNRLQEEEPMIREALEHFQITPNLTEDVMREISRLKPIAPSGSKPLVPWGTIGVSTLAVVFLMLGIGSQYLSHFQKPYSFDATSEMTVEIIEAPVVLNLEVKPDIRTQPGASNVSDADTTSNKQPNDDPVFQNNQTWSLPEHAIARFGKGVMGGSDRSVAFAPDGKRFAVATGAGIWIYDAQTYREITLLTGHTGVVRAVAFSADGKTFASGDAKGAIKLWNLETGDVTTLAERRLHVDSVAFSPDGKTLASGSWNGHVELWDIESGQDLASFKGHAFRVFSVAFSPDGKTIASGGSDNTIKLWDVETKQNIATLTGHKDIIFSVAFSPDGRILASGSQDDTVKLWHVETGQNLHTFKHRMRVFSVAFSPDGKIVAGGAYLGIKLWNIETGEEVRLKEGTTTMSGSIAFSTDGTTLASAAVDRFGGTPGAVTLWDIETGKDLATLHGHTERITTVAFSPDGQTLASGLRGGTVKLWNVKTGENIHTYRGGGDAVAFSPDGKTLAARGWNHIKLWDVARHKNISTIPIGREQLSTSTALAFSPDSKGLAWGTKNQVKLRKHISKSLFGFMNRNATTLKGHKDEVRSVAFSPDGKILASSVRHGTVKFWDTETGANIKILEDAGGPVVFSPDGKLLASCGNIQEIKLWDLETQTALMTLRGKAGAVFDLTFSPDGKILVSAEGFGTIKFWDVATGENIATLKGHAGIVFSVDFSSDGTILASGSQDGTVLLWNPKRVVESSSQEKKTQEQE